MVERPRELGRYTIVAAGKVTCNGTGQDTSYNGLNARIPPDRRGGKVVEGVVHASFNGYKQNNHYVVKVLAGLHPNPIVRPCIVQYGKFTRSYFELHVTDRNGNPVSRENLEQLELMIEVSQYEVLAPESGDQTGPQARKRER